MYRRQGCSQKHRFPQTEAKGQRWSHGTEVTSSRSLLSGAGVRWLAAPPAGLMVCAVHPILQRSDPGFRLGCSGRFSWQPPGRHPRHSLHYEESSGSYSGYTSQHHGQWRQLARHARWDVTGPQVGAVATMSSYMQENSWAVPKCDNLSWGQPPQGNSLPSH